MNDKEIFKVLKTKRVFPFDNERIYPMQEIEMTVNFKQYRVGRDY